MRNQYKNNNRDDQERQNRNQERRYQDRGYERGYGRDRTAQRNAGGRSDWYDADPMDDRSGYREETSDLRGYNDHYRYDQNYHSYYGSADYNPDRESDRYSRGQGAYGTTSSGQASWSPSEETELDNRHYGRGPKNFKRSDERIREEVCEMLTRHSGINAEDIDVEVQDGEVTLTGNVPERRMKHLAEDCAEQCFGVKDVTNNIRVKHSSTSGH